VTDVLVVGVVAGDERVVVVVVGFGGQDREQPDAGQ
jgi:hypothetical protein